MHYEWGGMVVLMDVPMRGEKHLHPVERAEGWGRVVVLGERARGRLHRCSFVSNTCELEGGEGGRTERAHVTSMFGAGRTGLRSVVRRGWRRTSGSRIGARL